MTIPKDPQNNKKKLYGKKNRTKVQQATTITPTRTPGTRARTHAPPPQCPRAPAPAYTDVRVSLPFLYVAFVCCIFGYKFVNVIFPFLRGL